VGQGESTCTAPPRVRADVHGFQKRGTRLFVVGGVEHLDVLLARRDVGDEVRRGGQRAAAGEAPPGDRRQQGPRPRPQSSSEGSPRAASGERAPRAASGERAPRVASGERAPRDTSGEGALRGAPAARTFSRFPPNPGPGPGPTAATAQPRCRSKRRWQRRRSQGCHSRVRVQRRQPMRISNSQLFDIVLERDGGVSRLAPAAATGEGRHSRMSLDWLHGPYRPSSISGGLVVTPIPGCQNRSHGPYWWFGRRSSPG
jgi:hypothetical protein